MAAPVPGWVLDPDRVEEASAPSVHVFVSVPLLTTVR